MLSAYLKDDIKLKTGLKQIEQEETKIDIKEHAPTRKLERQLTNKGYLPYSAGECYGKQITKNSYVFIQRVEETSKIWTGYRNTYDGDNMQSEKTIIEDINIIKVLDRTERYIRNYRAYLNKVG